MGFITILIYIVLSLSTGVFLISLSLGIINEEVLINSLSLYANSEFSLKFAFTLAGAILILLCLRYIQTFFHRSKRNRAITFESSGGKVSVTLFAIEDMLKRMLEERNEVSHVKPKVFLRRKAIEVTTRGILTTEVNLVEFTKEIQEKVKEKIHTLLGEDKEVRVNLEIRKVALGGKKGEALEKEPEIPFRNYD